MLLYFILSKDIDAEQRTEVTPGVLELNMLSGHTHLASHRCRNISRVRKNRDPSIDDD